MKNRIVFIFILLLLICVKGAEAQFYIGAGANYVMPQDDFADVNQNSIGVDVVVENRRLCNWWYGFRFQHNNYDPADDIEAGDEYFTESTTISPQIRYNFLYDDKYNSNLFPYLQAGILINTFNSTDDLSDLGTGLSGGAGVCYGFDLSNVCFILDLNVVYNSPTLIFADEQRPDINYIAPSLTLSVGI